MTFILEVKHETIERELIMKKLYVSNHKEDLIKKVYNLVSGVEKISDIHYRAHLGNKILEFLIYPVEVIGGVENGE